MLWLLPVLCQMHTLHNTADSDNCIPLYSHLQHPSYVIEHCRMRGDTVTLYDMMHHTDRDRESGRIRGGEGCE